MDIHGMRNQSWDDATKAEYAVWQPLMLVSPERLECGRCGAKAIFLCVSVDTDGDICDGEAFCQPCFQKAQEAEEE